MFEQARTHEPLSNRAKSGGGGVQALEGVHKPDHTDHFQIVGDVATVACRLWNV